MNYNIPHFKCYVRESYFTKSDSNQWYFCIAHAVQSLPNKILTFHVLTEHGIHRSRIPLSEIFVEISDKDIPHDFKQLWDCFGYDANIIQYQLLNRCQVILKDQTKIWAKYLFTIYWFNNAFSNDPTDYKCGHVLLSDDGYLLCQPNNRILWADTNFVTKELTPELAKSQKVDTEILSCEISSRWMSEDTNNYFYDVNRKDL
jgi:hypothetical protein